MTNLMLDTNVLIELLHGNKTLAPRLDKQKGRLTVSTVAITELIFGAERSLDPAAMTADLEALLQLVDVVDFDQNAARHAGQIRAALARAGQPIGPYDTLIAGHARALGHTLVTHNTREFGRVPNLKLEDWQVGNVGTTA